MSLFFRTFLLIFFTLFLLVLMVFRSWLAYKQTGKNPFVFPDDDTAYGLVGVYFKGVVLVLAAFVIVNFFFPQYYHHFLPIPWLENIYLKDIGAATMVISFVWIFVAQLQMRDSWRIGIDQGIKTELISSGLFRYSRNPVYLGMILALAGFFLVAPNAISLLILVLGYTFMQMQVRLEEEYMERMHGESYLNYRKRVRRWL